MTRSTVHTIQNIKEVSKKPMLKAQ